MQIVPEAEAELGYVDSIFGRGTWTRVGDGVFKYVIENCTVRVEFWYCEIAHLDKLRVCIGPISKLKIALQLSHYRWAENRVKSSPECVERFVCETYRTGENLEGVGYILLKVAK